MERWHGIYKREAKSHRYWRKSNIYLRVPRGEKGRTEVILELILAENFSVHVIYKSYGNQKAKTCNKYTKEKEKGK